MKIGVISDTHGEVSATRRAINIFDSMQVDLMIHCGDVGEDIVPLFDGRQVHFVTGNTDGDGLREAITSPAHTLHEELGSLEIEGRRIAFLHGHNVKLLHHTIHSGHWDLICHGHTHAFSNSREGKTLVLNPGALARTCSPSIAVVDLATMEVTEISV